MNKQWFQIIKEHACIVLREDYASYEGELMHLQDKKLYFVVEGCVIVRSKEDKHVLYLVRARSCLNLEELVGERYDYEYIRINQTRVLTIPIHKMHQLILKYPKLMPKLLRHEHYILDQMVQFSIVYRDRCQPSSIKTLYERIKPPFSYAVFQKYVNNDILTMGDSHDIKCQ